MLFDPQRHQLLTTKAWDSQVVQQEILTIINDIDNSLLANASWPTHPLDAQSYTTTGPKWAAYAGAAGTIHALQILKRYGYQIADLSPLLATVHSSFLQQPDVGIEPGLQLGQLGILVPRMLMEPNNQKLSKSLLQCMEATLALPFHEITSGQSGMMHAALALYRKTGNSCWQHMYVKGAKSLIAHWQQDNSTSEWLWKSQVFGPTRHYYGACHGIVGNANILLQGLDLYSDISGQEIINRTISTLMHSAVTDNNQTNWPLCTKPAINKLLVQWCHGAAGIITAMARTPNLDASMTKALDILLAKTGELVWQAGPVSKGANICHGTAGNGYAFLYLYQRWGDSIWLERAKCFAMHAIEQCQQHRKHYGQGRYTLWTGDAGLAIYLYHCLNPAETAIPGLDLF